MNENTKRGDRAQGPEQTETPSSQPADKPGEEQRRVESSEKGPRLKVDWSPDGAPEAINLTFRE